MTFLIRRLSQEDSEQWIRLREEALLCHRPSFGVSLSSSYDERRTTYLDWLTRSPVFGAFDKTGKLIGTAGFYREASPMQAHRGNLFSFYVSSEDRRRGVGQELLATVIDEARQNKTTHLLLSVYDTQKEAIALYEKNGFQTYGVLPHAAIDQNVAIDQRLMIKALT